tara:strand:+ start:227 stop:1330 length:1104 start_codon:yes stop_codon:yes gene_type:complete
MNWIKILCSQLMIGILLFTIVDYTYTNHFLSLNPFDPEIEKKYRVSNQFFHHSLKPNFKGKSMWGRNIYEICTDSNGFKSKCNNNFEDNKNFEIGFIGDSFTEAVGLPFDESFVGIFAENNQNLKIANLGVSSYSPTIYLEKIKWHLDNGYTFKHIIVFVDISDIQDEDHYSNYANFRKDLTIIHQENLDKIVNLKTFIKKNFYLSFFAYNLLLNNLKNESENSDSLDSIFTQSRSSWTFDQNSQGYENLGIQGSINRALNKLEKLYLILEQNNIKMSVAVYPWPAQLEEIKRNPNIQNMQSQIWEKFCLGKCTNFIDLFSIFEKEINENSVEYVYSKYYINGDVHFNYEGNKLIYEQLEENLVISK